MFLLTNLIEICQNGSGGIMTMNIKFIIFHVISIMEYKWPQCWTFRKANLPNCMPFIAIIKYDYNYKILHIYVGLCKHIILLEQLNRGDNTVSFELLRIKIYQILIKLDDLL